MLLNQVILREKVNVRKLGLIVLVCCILVLKMGWPQSLALSLDNMIWQDEDCLRHGYCPAPEFGKALAQNLCQLQFDWTVMGMLIYFMLMSGLKMDFNFQLPTADRQTYSAFIKELWTMCMMITFMMVISLLLFLLDQGFFGPITGIKRYWKLYLTFYCHQTQYEGVKNMKLPTSQQDQQECGLMCGTSPTTVDLLTPCGHFFHHGCLFKWLKIKFICPFDRNPKLTFARMRCWKCLNFSRIFCFGPDNYLLYQECLECTFPLNLDQKIT